MTVALSPARSRRAAGRKIETASLVVLTVLVLVTLAAVVVSGDVAGVPAPSVGTTSGSSATAAPPPDPAAAPQVDATPVRAASDAVEANGGGATFTVGELVAGEVTAEQFDAFWQGELDRISTAPCPSPAAPGTTVVVASIGATPPAHLGEDYVDFAPLLADARAAAAAACT